MTVVLLATSCLLPMEIPKEILLKITKYKCMLNESRQQQLRMQNKSLKKKVPRIQGRAIFVSETSPIPTVWISHQNASGHRQITLYSSSKCNILSSTGWLTDSQVEAAQDLLKSQFPLVDCLEDPSIVGDLVTPAASEFVQIINTGSH